MTRQIIRGLAVSLALAVSSYGASQQGGAARAGTDKEITIRIHNYSGANFSVVGHAERVADSILREAGVNTVWVECPVNQDSFHGPICAAPLSSLDFVVNLVPRSMSDHWHLGGGVLGLAIEAEGKGFGFSASIFYDVVRDCAKQRREDLDQILGTAIAHELGLSFSSAEAELVQRAVLDRRLAALNAAETSESVTFVPRSTNGTVEVFFAK
jgi:hypothetical protein